jgi:hypothetical protein
VRQVKVLDKSLITNTAARDTQGVDWAQVDDSVLKFETEAQPSAAMCATHAHRAVLEAEDQKWIEPVSQPYTTTCLCSIAIQPDVGR